MPDYAGHELAGIVATADVDLAETLRRRRHAAEYGEIPSTAIGAGELAAYIALADRTTRAVRATLPALAGASSSDDRSDAG